MKSKQMYKLKSTLFLIFISLTTPLYSQFHADTAKLNFATFSFFVDSTNTLSKEKIQRKQFQFTALESKNLKASYAYTYWLKGVMPSINPNDSLLYLSIGNLDEMTLYFRQDSIQNGRTIHPEKKIFSGYPYFFPLKNLSTSEVLIKINNRHFSEKPIMKPIFHSMAEVINIQGEQIKKRQPIHFLYGIFCGCLLAFFIYPITLFTFHQEHYYFFYGLYVISSFFFFLLTFERYANVTFLFSYFPFVLNYFERELNTLHVFFYLLFLWSFYRHHNNSSKLFIKVLRWLVYFYFLVMFVGYVFEFGLQDTYFRERTSMIGVIGGLPMAAISIYFIFKIPSKDSKLIGTGFIIYLIGMCLTLYFLYSLQNPTDNLWLENPNIFSLLGIIGELFFFSLALSYRNKHTIQQQEVKRNELQNLNELNLTKTKLYTNITHEFRTPLTVILGLVDQLKVQPKVEVKERLQIIKNNSKQLLKLVNEFMDLSLLDAGNLKLNYQQADVVSFLGFICDSFKNLAQVQNKHLTYYRQEEQLLMDFDADKLQQIIVNLLNNALKFTSEYGEITLNVSQKKGKLHIIVQDNGIGIPKEKQAMVFDRFFQVNDTAIRENEGSGIGLAIVKELIELMDGEILLQSIYHKGSTFTIKLPIQNQTNLSESFTPFIDQLISLPNQAKIPTIKPKKFKDLPLLLIVEDNPDVIYFMKSCLDGKYETVVARNGEEGFQIAIELLPNLIITDIMMPKMDGFQLIQQLKSNVSTQSIPILIVTAKATKTDRLKGLKLGASTYLFKPFSSEELLLQVEKNLPDSLSSLSVPHKLENSEDALFLEKLYQIIEANLANDLFHTPDLAKALMISRTQLFRKVKAITNQAPSDLIRRIRLERAKRLLITSDLNIGEIAQETGFKDQSYFSKVFLKTFQQTPSSFRVNNKS